MRRRWHMPRAFAAFIAVLLVLSCDHTPQSTGTPFEPQASGNLLPLPDLSTTRPEPSPSRLVWITESPSSGPRFASLLIGVLGGTLSLDAHSVVVPQGAVQQLTLFTAFAPRTPAIDVELHAYLGNVVGGVLRLLRMFDRPVTLELSYARATNVANPDELVIVRLLDDGRYEILPTTVDKQRKVIRAQLDHFSKYAMASN